MQLYQFLNAESTAVLQTETRRCIYLDQSKTIHTEAYIKWRDGWSEVIPAKHEVTTPYSSTTKPAWIEKVGDEYIEHQAETIVVDEVVINTPESTVIHIPHVTDPYIPPVPVPVLPPTVADFVNALTLHLDAVAQQRQYDNRITCMVRAGFPGPFQAEGLAFAAWADTCNATAYALLAEVQAGTRPLPASTQELIDVMPPMVWPT